MFFIRYSTLDSVSGETVSVEDVLSDDEQSIHRENKTSSTKTYCNIDNSSGSKNITQCDENKVKPSVFSMPIEHP